MMEGEKVGAGPHAGHVRRLLGGYEGMRGYHLLPDGVADARNAGSTALDPAYVSTGTRWHTA